MILVHSDPHALGVDGVGSLQPCLPLDKVVPKPNGSDAHVHLGHLAHSIGVQGFIAHA